MACGCDSKMGCECVLQAGDGVSITGLGTAGDPFVIENSRPQLGVQDTPSLDLTVSGNMVSGKVRLAPVLGIADTPTVDMSLNGAGTEASPFVLSAAMKGVDLSGGSTGNVLTQKPDGTWGPGPATQAPAGSVVTANGIRGDGSGGNPVRLSKRTYAEWEAIVDAAVF